jgi:hypothetical protein
VETKSVHLEEDSMKRATYLILVGILSAGGAMAQSQQQPGTQAGASASSSTVAEASRGNSVQAGNTSSGGDSAQHNGDTVADTSLSAGGSLSASKNGARAESSAVNSTAASAEKSRTAASASERSAANSTMNATLLHPVDARKNKPGDPVRARTTGASQSPDGTPLPKGTELVGHVTQTQSRTKNQPESDLGIVFDKAVLKNGQEVPINGAIQAVAAARNSASAADNFGDAGLDGGSMAGGGLAAVGSAGPGRAGSVGGGGGLSGVGRSVGSATAPVSNAGSSARGAAGTTTGAVGSTAATVAPTAGAAGTMTRGVTGGLNAAGELTSNSQGVFNLQGLNLATAASSATGAAQSSLLTSGTKNVHLESGTQLLVSATSAAQLQASK